MHNKAVKLSIAATILCIILVIALSVAAPWVIGWYARIRQVRESGRIALLIAFYGCVPPALAALCVLLKLLSSVRDEKVFSQKNSRLMAVLSWCCVAVALITGAGARWYPPLLFVTASMAFLFLIVRVVRNCLIAATAIKEENSLTI